MPSQKMLQPSTNTTGGELLQWMGKLQASQILKSKRIWVERMRAPLEKQKPLRGASVQIRHASIQPAPCIAKATAKGGPYFL